MEEHEAQYCYQDRNSSCRKDSISTSTYITLYIFFSLISAITVFLNLLVTITISHFKHLQTPTNLLILSLAVSDLLVGLIAIPAITVAVMQRCWVLGGYYCALLIYITYLCTSSSIGNLVMISIDRYIAVCDPLKYHSKITITRIQCGISFSWSFCVIFGILSFFKNMQVHSKCFEDCYLVRGEIGTNIIGLVITMGIPCSIIITLYLKIFVVARSQARKVFSKVAATVSGGKTAQASKSERKAAKTLAIVVFNYLICWIPMYISRFFINFADGSLLSAFVCFLPLVNSLINPIIYAFFYPWFKVTANRILTLKFRCL